MERRDFLKSCSAGLALGAGALSANGVARAAEGKPELDADKVAKSAYEHFIPGGLTCCESIALAGCEALGIKSDLIPDITLGLAGGVGLQGQTCGCITGAAMVLSLAVAAQEKDYATKKKRVLQATGRLYKQFAEQFGTTQCRQLCGLDLTTPEGMQKLAGGVKKDVCTKFVDAAARTMTKELAGFQSAGAA
jgi:C_GCAxxG_C_C family probable redox protein